MIISTCNQYEKDITEILYILCTKSLKSSVYFTLSAPQLELAAFQVPNSHLWKALVYVNSSAWVTEVIVSV